MKSLADKLVVSLSGESNEREADATTLSSFVLGNLDREGHQIYDCKRAYWYHRLPTLRKPGAESESIAQ